ncbi:hypothetical protein ACLB2K_031345 [Fragaria x ananassa]
MSGVHNVFHVSLLKKYIPDASHVIDYGAIKVNADATFVVEPVRILDKSTKRLQRKEVDLVKVCWSHHDEGDASWELESDMWAKYPKLFLAFLKAATAIKSHATSIFAPSDDEDDCVSNPWEARPDGGRSDKVIIVAETKANPLGGCGEDNCRAVVAEEEEMRDKMIWEARM